MKIELKLEKMIVPQQRKGITKRVGKLRFYDRDGVSNREVKMLLRFYKPKTPIADGVQIKLDVTFYSKIKSKKKWWQWKTTRPDIDNLLKNLQDYLTRFEYYHDDSQIVELHARKFYAESNVIKIELTEIDENERE